MSEGQMRGPVLAQRKDPLWPAGHLPHKGGDDSWQPRRLRQFPLRLPPSPHRGGDGWSSSLPHRIEDGCGIRISIAIRKRCIMRFRPIGGGNRCLTVPLPLVGRVGRGLHSVCNLRRQRLSLRNAHRSFQGDPFDPVLHLRQPPQKPLEPPRRLIRARRRAVFLRLRRAHEWQVRGPVGRRDRRYAG